MGFKLNREAFDAVLQSWADDYVLFAPKRFEQGGIYSDTDCIRYGQVQAVDEIVFDSKSLYSFKEALLPVSETLFFFTEETVKEADPPKKGAIIFLRSCDLHGLKRLDEIYLRNGPEDAYYRRLRDRVQFVLMGCPHSFENCFCVSMGTNQATDYAISVDVEGDGFLVDCKSEAWAERITPRAEAELDVTPRHVTENAVTVNIPETLTIQVASSRIWDEYDNRCIDCGRCNFVCPTCTCFTMQDLFYTENGRVGERRRIWASCMVDGFTDVAGGGSYRKKNGERMRFKVLHKVYDFKVRTGSHMCVGCGRCDDVCPEYISFSNSVNKLDQAMKEVSGR